MNAKREKTARAPRRGVSMTTVMVLVVVGLVACMLLFSTAIFIARYKNAIVQSARTSSAQAVAQVANTVGGYTHDMDEVLALLTQTLEDPTVDREDFFSTFLKMRPDVVAVTCYDSAGALVDCWCLGHEPKQNITTNLSFDSALANEKGGYLSDPHVETIFDSYYPWVVTLAAPVNTAGQESWIALDFSFTSISSTINNVGIGQHGYCFIIDDAGNIIYHPQQQLIYSGLKTENTAPLAALADGTRADNSVITSLQTVANGSWRVVGVSYVDELVNANVTAMIRLAAAIVAGVLAATLVSSLILSRVLSRPLGALAAAMADFERSADRFAYQPVRGSREVRELSDSFGHMVGKIQQLMAKVREEEIDLRKTELKALQAQINPHFLYNTLDSIAWMCEQGRSEDAVQMVHALATLFRISISRGHELIPISKEIEHAQSYLRIQKYRYKNQFEYTFRVDPECADYLCNKITLQPIIENAICHGLDLMVEEGLIEITVRQDGGDILFIVADNGVGMPQEQADKMLCREPNDRTGIGIKNVNDRLRIYFGEKYGLRITSEPDVGTTVEIRMPKVKEGEYETK